MTVRKQTIVLSVVFAVFCAAIIGYFYYFDVSNVGKPIDGRPFLGEVNSHDHLYYVDTISRLRDEGVGYELNNDVGISYFFLVLSDFFIGDNEGYAELALFVNVVFLFLTFFIYIKVCDFYGFDLWGKLLFFAGIHLVYFAQLINKDMLSVFLILLPVYCVLYRKWWWLLLATPFFFLVRQQLFIYLVSFVFLYTAVWPFWRILVVYMVTCLVASYVVVHANIIGTESLEGGFSSFVYSVNESSYLGYLFFNPVRVLQFVQDALLSFFFLTPEGVVDMGRLLRVPQVLCLLIMSRPIFNALVNTRTGMHELSRPLYCSLVSYLMAWLMNPTVNARYVMLIAPVLVLLALYAKKNMTQRSEYA